MSDESRPRYDAVLVSRVAVPSDPSGYASRRSRRCTASRPLLPEQLPRARAGLRERRQSHPDGVRPAGEHLPRPRRGALGRRRGARSRLPPSASRTCRSCTPICWTRRTSARSTTSSRTASTRGCRRPVQERVLAIASEVLAPNGVAYVSYNALPGCHVRNAMRQMMRWHVRDIEEPSREDRARRGASSGFSGRRRRRARSFRRS